MPRPAPLTIAVPDLRQRDDGELARTIESLRSGDVRPAQVIVAGSRIVGDRLGTHSGARFVEVAAGDGREARQAALESATEEWFAILEPGAELQPDALATIAAALRVAGDDAIVYTDEHSIPPGASAAADVLKPGWSRRLILDGNYLGRLCIVRTSGAIAAGGYDDDDVATGGYDLILRLVDAGALPLHVPVTAVESAPGDAWPPTAGPAARPAACDAARRSVERRGSQATVVENGPWQRVRRTSLRLPVTVIVPTRDRVDLLSTCLESVQERTVYPNFEILVVDNDSTDPATLEFLATTGHRVLRHPGAFNFSKIVNAAVATTTTPLVLLLNNDTEVLNADWLDAMVEELIDPAVGAVGCRLLGQEGEPQHEGIALGIEGAAAVNLDLGGYCAFDQAVRDVAAVTAACVLFPRASFDAIGGFDPELAVGWGDVDFCLRLRRAGYDVVYTPHAVVRHLGQASRGITPHRDDDALFALRWPLHRSREMDPFVNRRIEGFAPLRVSETVGQRPVA